MNVEQLLNDSTRKLKDSSVESPRLDTILLLEAALKQPREWILANPNELIKPAARETFNELLDQRLKRKPVAQILGVKEFYGRTFTVNEGVLTPRPETEALVEEAIKTIPKNAKVLEIGTGSGCIAISLKLERPDLEVIATDISKPALVVARSNAANLRGDISFIESNLFDAVPAQKFDAVLANLPYIPVGDIRQPEIEHEPNQALYSGKDGLDLYRDFFIELSQHITNNGVCLIEYSPSQHNLANTVLNKLKMKSETISDYVYRITLELSA